LALARHFGVEFTAGVGAAWLSYAKNDCSKCGDEAGRYGRLYFGPTELGIKLVLMIK
jgi:hypothetical protein